MRNCEASNVDDKTLIFRWIENGKIETGGRNKVNRVKVRNTGYSGEDAMLALNLEVAKFREECLEEAAKDAAQKLSRFLKPGVIVKPRVVHYRASVIEPSTARHLDISDRYNGRILKMAVAAAAQTSEEALKSSAFESGGVTREERNRARLPAPKTPSPPSSPPSSPTPGTPVPSPPLSPSRPPPY